MNIIPDDTMREIDNMRREIDRVYRFPFTFFEDGSAIPASAPFMDIYETDSEVIISCDLPGLQQHAAAARLSFEDAKAVYRNGTLNLYLPKKPIPAVKNDNS